MSQSRNRRWLRSPPVRPRCRREHGSTTFRTHARPRINLRHAVGSALGGRRPVRAVSRSGSTPSRRACIRRRRTSPTSTASSTGMCSRERRLCSWGLLQPRPAPSRSRSQSAHPGQLGGCPGAVQLSSPSSCRPSTGTADQRLQLPVVQPAATDAGSSQRRRVDPRLGGLPNPEANANCRPRRRCTQAARARASTAG